MAQGWVAYSLILYSAILSLLIPLGLRVLALIFARNKKTESKIESKQVAHIERPLKVNGRFFLAAPIAAVLISLSLVMIPVVAVLKDNGIGALALISVIFGFVYLGLFYASRKGDLSWLKEFNK